MMQATSLPSRSLVACPTPIAAPPEVIPGGHPPAATFVGVRWPIGEATPAAHDRTCPAHAGVRAPRAQGEAGRAGQARYESAEPRGWGASERRPPLVGQRRERD
jgi:hypothetical protein